MHRRFVVLGLVVLASAALAAPAHAEDWPPSLNRGGLDGRGDLVLTYPESCEPGAVATFAASGPGNVLYSGATFSARGAVTVGERLYHYALTHYGTIDLTFSMTFTSGSYAGFRAEGSVRGTTRIECRLTPSRVFGYDPCCATYTARMIAPNGRVYRAEGSAQVVLSDRGAFHDFSASFGLSTSTLLPACSDGSDNDGDGRIDFPADPGCAAGADTHESPDATPALRPNGEVVFMSRRADGNGDIWTIDPSTGAERRLTDATAAESDPVFSPDGSRIAFVSKRTGFTNIWVMDADGRNAVNLTQTPGTHWEGSPTWSPDGAQIAYSALDGIWVVDVATRAKRRLGGGAAPAWSPDGGRIAYVGSSGHWRGWSAVFVMNADGTNPRMVTSGQNGHDFEPSWSPDGTSLAFTSTRSTGGEVWVVDVETREERVVASCCRPGHDGGGTSAAWSPDGSKIVYSSIRLTNDSELWVMNADGSGKTRLTSSPGADMTPHWGAYARDTTPPVLTVPADMTVEATGPGGATVTFAATATDDRDASPTVACTPSSGAQFVLGRTVVTCTARDAADNPASDTFTVTVVDTTAPELSVPDALFVEATSPAGAAAAFAATATDLVDEWPVVTCDPPSGSVLRLGETTVGCVAVDDAGNRTEASFVVTVRDTTAPSVLASFTPDKGGRFTIGWTCADAVGVTSESAQLNGVVVTNSETVRLKIRPELDWKRNAKTLTISAPSFQLTVTCTDAAGNAGTGTASPSATDAFAGEEAG